MKYHLTKGITLIEALVYASLLSLLLFGCVATAYDIHVKNNELLQEIEDAQNS